MQIAARHGYRDGFHPAAALMDRARVIPARDHRFGLAADIFPLREGKGKIIELPVIERAPIHKGNHSALPKRTHALMRLHACDIRRRGRFHYNRIIGVQLVGGCPCAAQPHFLLHGKGKIEIIGKIAFNHLQQNRTTRAVVERLGFDPPLAERHKD